MSANDNAAPEGAARRIEQAECSDEPTARDRRRSLDSSPRRSSDDASDRRQAIRARLDAITSPRPWKYRFNRGVTDAHDDSIARRGWYDRDGEFVAHAPNDIEWLLDRVEALEILAESRRIKGDAEGAPT